MRYAEAFHLMRSHAHDEGFARAYLVVAYPAAVLQEHPHTVLLAGIDALDAILAAKGF